MVPVTSASAPYVLIGGAAATILFFRSMSKTTDFIAKMLCLGAALWALNKTYVAFSYIKDELQNRPHPVQRVPRQPQPQAHPSTTRWLYQVQRY